MKCRHCGTGLEHTFVDLGFAPPSNAYLKQDDLQKPEVTYPLKVMVCDECWLVQTQDFTEADALFDSEYAYFSSTSKGWLKHAEEYCQMITNRLGLNGDSFVIELASNDGYLLKNFVSGGIPCLGIEPTDSTAEAAEKLGIPVKREFFGEALGKDLAAGDQQADLIIGNNVYAHVPDINDFTKGMAAALKLEGTITLEFPHLLELIKHTQFDTIYHEHFSYLSLIAVGAIFTAAGLRIYDVEQLSTHGGSLRVYGCHENASFAQSDAVTKILTQEREFGLDALDTYIGFQERANNVKNNFLTFLIDQKNQGKTIAAYGAAAKGNTILNYAGVKTDLIDFVCDAAVAKQGKFLPGSHIPILPPEALKERKPDLVVILPWNIAAEVQNHHNYIFGWGGVFITAVPELKQVDG